MADELELEATMRDAVSDIVDRIERRFADLERQLEEVNRAGRAAGEGVEDGARDAERALRDQERQTEAAREEIERLREEAERARQAQRRQREETDRGSSAWDRYTARVQKASRGWGRFSRLFAAFKWSAVIGLIFAAAGAVGALGAAAVLAAANLAVTLPGLAALGPIGLAAAVGFKAATLGLAAMEPQANRIKEMFAGLGEEVADGGFRTGLDYLADRMGPFADEVAQGFGWIGQSLGRGARGLGDFLADSYRLDQTEKIFWSLSDIIDNLQPGVIGFGGSLMNVLTAALPAGTRLSDVLGQAGVRMEAWTRRQLESGRATEVINTGLDRMLIVARVVGDYLVGVWNVIAVATGVTTGFGAAIADAGEKFRVWSGSIEGQAAIAQYFRDATPALREMGLLIVDAAKGMAMFLTSEGLAPLLNQLRTEALPAFFALAAEMSGQGGLIPALLDGFTQIAKLLTALDLTALTMIAQGFADAVKWLGEMINASPALGAFVSTFALIWVLGGAILSIAGGLMGAWGWLMAAKMGAEGLTVAQMLLGWTIRTVSAAATAARFIWIGYGGAVGIATMIMNGARTAALFMWAAVTGPVGLVVMAIAAVIAIVVLLWNNCEWFRNAVLAAWEWIKNAAIASWTWIQQAAATTWNAIVGFINVAVAVISGILNFLWLAVIQPIWNAIVVGAQIAWAIISFIVQTAIFLIVAIITVLALVLEGIWWAVSTAATHVWYFTILPAIQTVAAIATAVWTAVSGFFAMIWNAISAAATVAWNVVILPAIQTVAGIAQAIWSGVSAFFGMIWSAISTAASSAWNGVIAPVFGVVAGIAQAVWSPISAFFSTLFGVIGRAGAAAFDGISRAASVVAGVVRGAWDAVVGAVRGAYNAIARGWNSIPSITVPAWVPGIGGSTFGLPKLPTLWHGGTIEYGAALVGEQGPEPFIGPGGQYMGMLGMNGPEIAAGLPRGGYVVPNLDTLTRMPGLLKTLPSGVGDAVARSVPGYAGLLSGPTVTVSPPSPAARDSETTELAHAVRALARAVDERPPTVVTDGHGDVEDQVYRALRKWEQRKELRERYSYGGRT